MVKCIRGAPNVATIDKACVHFKQNDWGKVRKPRLAFKAATWYNCKINLIKQT